jgi:L-ribulose-5-phosphate 4-epimerase
MLLEKLRHEVWQMHLELPKNGLVTWTTGNISGRDFATDLVVIKPSGVRYEAMQPEDLVVVDLQGNVVEGDLSPSVDTPTHLYVYRHRTDVGGIVHTHSTYATAFAALGRPIPIVLTAMADEFGGSIPCGRYCKIGGEEIGQEIVRAIGSYVAILIKNHGPFTVGPTPTAATKAAVMVEDSARTVHLAMQLGQPEEIPAEEVERGHRRYVGKYGQRTSPGET